MRKVVCGRVSSTPHKRPRPAAFLIILAGSLAELPEEFREVIVMRELEGMGYKEIAEVAGIPIGTVMSRLARARQCLQRLLTATPPKES